jgi:hypothetical protein
MRSTPAPLAFQTFVDEGRPPALVQTGQYPNPVAKHDVEQGVWKPWDKRARSFAVRHGACEGMLSNEVHDKVERGPEPTPETGL